MDIMPGRIERLEVCGQISNPFLVSSELDHGFCAPIDNQGLYFVSKYLTNFLNLEIYTIAISILSIPLISSIILALYYKWSRSSLALVLIIIAAADIFFSRLFLLIEWAFPFWACITISLILYNFYIKRKYPGILLLFFLGLLVSFLDWFRPSAGFFGQLTFITILYLYSFQFSWKVILKNLVSFYIGFLIASIVVDMIDNKILNQAKLLGFDWVHMNHLTWHMILIGFGYVKSNLGLIFADMSGIQYITKYTDMSGIQHIVKYNGDVYVDGYSRKYEELARLATLDIIYNYPMLVLETFCQKLIKITIHIFSFIFLFIICNFRNDNLKNLFLSLIKIKEIRFSRFLIPIVLIYIASIPGILVVPSRYYITGALSILLLFCVHLILNKELYFDNCRQVKNNKEKSNS